MKIKYTGPPGLLVFPLGKRIHLRETGEELELDDRHAEKLLEDFPDKFTASESASKRKKKGEDR